MNILLLGSGGREHAIAYKIAQSSKLSQLYVAPGNAGTLGCGINVNLNVEDFEAIKTFVLENNVEMVVVGPEAPLVAGVVDFFKNDDKVAKTMQKLLCNAMEYLQHVTIPLQKKL